MSFKNAQFAWDQAMPIEDPKGEFIELYGDRFENEDELDQAWINELRRIEIDLNDERYY